jgi:hypothetical protein
MNTKAKALRPIDDSVALTRTSASPADPAIGRGARTSLSCTGVGGAYCTDQPDDLAFLADHGITP